MNSFHYLMMVTQSTFQRRVLDLTAKEGLLPGQPKVLDFLKDNDGCEQKAIARGCCLDPATVTGLLNRMETAGLITRSQQNGNRRSFHIYMTEKGKSLQEKTELIFDQCESLALKDVAPEEFDVYMKVLRKIYTNLTEGETAV